MAYYGQQPQQPQPPQHPAVAYYPGYAAAPPKDLTVLAWLAFFAAVLVTLFTVVDATVVGRAIRHVDDPVGTLDWSVAVYAIGSLLSVLALIGGFVVGSMWLYRARTNAELMAPGRAWSRSAGWAWGGWVCPIVNLWFPFQVVRDTHRNVSPLSTSPVVGWWWGLFLAFTLFDRILGTTEDGLTPEDASGYQAASIVFALLTVAALLAWGQVLRTITREQHDRIYGRAAA